VGLKSEYYRGIAKELAKSASYIQMQIDHTDDDIGSIRRAYDTGELYGDANNLYLDISVRVLKELQTQLDTMNTILSQTKVCESKALDKARYWEEEEARAAAKTNTSVASSTSIYKSALMSTNASISRSASTTRSTSIARSVSSRLK
jgi:hypothetical protein